MGLSSLMAMELRNRLERPLARPLSATLAWNYPTVDALVGHPRRRRTRRRRAAADARPSAAPVDASPPARDRISASAELRRRRAAGAARGEPSDDR